MERRIQRFILEAGHRICLIIGGIYWLDVLLYFSLSHFPLLFPPTNYTVDFQLRTHGRLF